MIGIIRTISVTLGSVVALAFSQAPEFAQQYEQRLGGAIGELEPIVANFDADAQRADLSREEALALYGRSHEQFLKDRGKSMLEVFDRYEKLVRQRRILTSTGEFLSPAVILYSADMSLVSETGKDFKPAVPLTLAGIAHAALGFVLAMLAASGIRALARGRDRMRWSTDL